MTLIKSISGIRGTVGGVPGDNLTPVDIVKFAAAYGRWLCDSLPAGHAGRPTIVLGRDARISGPMVAALIESTLLGCGIDVADLGLASTPSVEMAVTGKRADGGIIVTASHNPAQWNALKLLNRHGEFLDDAEGKKILALAEQEDFSFVDVEKLGNVVSRESYDAAHIDAVMALPLVDTDTVRKRRFKVVVDAVNSVGGIVIPALLRRLGAEVIELNCTPDGRFAHNPEPLAENLTAISAEVVRVGADLGVVVDPDVDRLALVCEDGKMFGEEYTLVAVADYVLSRLPGPGNTVSNLSSSRALRDVTRARGGQYAAAAVGEVNVVAKMKETGAVIGGEGNGGVIYPELHYGRDALVGVALFLSALSRSRKSCSQLRAGLPLYEMSKNKIELSPEVNVDNILETIKRTYANEQVTDIDGIKIDWPDGWVHLRKSNTEPIIRIYSEAPSFAAAQALATRIQDLVREIMR